MRVLLDANVILDCLVLEADGSPRAGKAASDLIMNRCDAGIHHGLVAWHSLPIVAYYHGRQNPPEETGAMLDSLLKMLEVPSVSHGDAASWRRYGLNDFEDALQLACALSGKVEVLVTRNKADFQGGPVPVMTPEEFLAAFPEGFGPTSSSPPSW